MQAEYLVTGGCGFIGSNIVRSLTGAGHAVRVLDNLATGNLLNIRDLIDQGCVEFQHGDIRNPDAAHQACAGIRNVLHLAALPSVVGSVEDPALSHAVNLDGVVNMLVAARKAGVQRFVFSSSSAVYGDDPELPKRETMLPAPLSPYAVQKLSGEYYCRIFHGLYGLETFCLRYFNVFGPRQNPRSQYAAVVPLFIEAVREGRRPVVFGDGGQTRDFIYVGDIVQANLQCCRAPASAAGGVYNIAWGRRMTIKELAETVAKTMGHPELTARHEPTRPGEIRDSHADTTQAQSVLGWSPQVPFVEGLKRTVEWFAHGVG
jgi:nucleoside-diphosphate-sugar epimerase